MKIPEPFVIVIRITIIVIVFFLLFRITIIMMQDPLEEFHYDYGAFNDTLIEAPGEVYNSGAIMVQLDWFCDIIGAEMTRNKRTITINWQDNELIVKLYSKKATLNGETFYQNVCPVYKNGKVFIHIRTIWENLKLRTGHYGLCEFEYDTSQNHFHVYTWEYLNARKATATN